MKYKTLTLLMLVFVILTLSVKGLEESFWYKCEDDITDSSSNGYNLSAQGTPSYSATAKEGSKSCYFNEVWYAEKTSGVSYVTGNMNRSFTAWFNLESFPAGGSNDRFWELGDKGVNRQSFSLYFYDANDIRIDLYNDALTKTLTTPDTGIWFMTTYTYNASNRESCFWFNDTIIDCGTHAGNSDFVNEVIRIGNRDGGGWGLDGYMDNIRYYDNHILTQEEITELWSDGDGCDTTYESCGGSPTPSLALNTNLINNTQNYNFPELNFTYNGTLANHNIDIANCSFYKNNVLNSTIEVNLSINNLYNFTIGQEELWWNITFNCSNYEVTDEIDYYYYYRIDTIDPFFNITFTNNTDYTQGDTVTFTANITDNNLFAYNISWFNPNGVLLQNSFAENLTDYSIQNISTYTASTVGNNYSISIFGWDSHTKKEIKNKIVKSITNGYEFDGIKISSIQELNSKKYNKEKDKYTWEFEFKNKKDFYDIILEGYDFRLIENSPYGFHLIDWETKQWIDLRSENIDNIVIKTKEKNYYEVTIKVKNKNKPVKFMSIGDLNEISETYYFNVESIANVDLTNVENSLDEILEVIKLTPIVILYIGLMSLGYYMINTKNFIGGIILMLNSLPLDFIIIKELFDDYISQVASTWQGSYVFVFLGLIGIWWIMKVAILISVKGAQKA